ncbi:thioredoxin-like domain-containing protein [Flavobacterium aquatile]|uniref:Alkyl hydroperoxide reductase n=1 Tax=Flavobacterium aquatile LMG 4008 = ATCC 11947 TaxID=1453498 RepID=A0A095V0Z8_9FLAO|nr:thioredoxin-like domain-containing protein [Flavobacterium aquatile]KGD68535.1 alkyl hydroperoxide reductase [Flavobacterium aquatile LMG 4008 = ATCC 11947]OXA69023.1 alkyl hydroperoxide reductase [Flavobacterium aquatile LMG 4008 = ATCC 11947]
MKNILLILSIVMTTISCTNAQETQFSEEALNGIVLNSESKETAFRDILEKHKGKTILIEVWASWCSDCVKAMPKLKEIQKENPEVVYVFISMDKSFEKWNEGIKKHEIVGEHYWVNDEKGMKGSFGQSIDLDWIPRYIIVRGEMEVTLYRAIEKDFDKINQALK